MAAYRKDNPFVGDNNALPRNLELWAIVIQQELFYNSRHSAKLWDIEHAPRGGDEINLIEAVKKLYGCAGASHW